MGCGGSAETELKADNSVSVNVERVKYHEE